MYHRTAPRVLSLVLTLWVGLLTSELPGLHACPMHSSPVHEHAGGAMPHHRGSGKDDGRAPARCTCLGTCAGSFATTPPEAALLPVVRLPAVALPEREPEARLPTPVAHVLPFAHAPPLPL